VFLRASPYLCVNFWRILNFILVLDNFEGELHKDELLEKMESLYAWKKSKAERTLQNLEAEVILVVIRQDTYKLNSIIAKQAIANFAY
jgi:hypothetical protein